LLSLLGYTSPLVSAAGLSMPSPLSVFAIVVFWVGTLAVVIRRDVWPRLFSTGPPPVSVEVGDEASQLFPTPWTIYRGNDRVGRLETRTTYVDADNSYQFTHDYSMLQLDVSGVRILVPRLQTLTKVSPTGALRAQSLRGRCEAQFQGLKLEATLDVKGHVENEQFVGECDFDLTVFKLKRPLVPVPVPNGHALSPLQVVNRVLGIRPGQEWVVHELNPLADAVALLIREQLSKTGFSIPEQKAVPLVARVSNDIQRMPWKDGQAACWVIEYRDEVVKARTWVRADDGKVLKQEAFNKGEQLTVLRDE
jgi:hypothetical protein